MGCTLGAQKVAKAEAKKEGKPTKNKEKNGKSDSKQDLVNQTTSKNGQECNIEKHGEENIDTKGSDTPKEDSAKTVASADQGLDQKGDSENNSNPDLVVTSPGSTQVSTDEPEVSSNNTQIEAVTKEPEGDLEGQRETPSEHVREQTESNGEAELPSCSEKDINTAKFDGEGKQEPAASEAEAIPVAVLRSEYSIEPQKEPSDVADEVPVQSIQDSNDNNAKTVEICQENMTEKSRENIVSTERDEVSTTESPGESKTQEAEVSMVESSENKVDGIEQGPVLTPRENEADEIEVSTTESHQVKNEEMENDVSKTPENVVGEITEQPVESPQENTLQETKGSTVEDIQGKSETQTEEIVKSIVETQENKSETQTEEIVKSIVETQENKSETQTEEIVKSIAETQENKSETQTEEIEKSIVETQENKLEKTEEEETQLNLGEIPEGNKEIIETDLNTIETQENKDQESEEIPDEIQEENKIAELEGSVSETLPESSNEKANETMTETVEESKVEKADESEIESSHELKDNDNVMDSAEHSEENKSLETQAGSVSNEQNIEKEVKEIEDAQPSQETVEDTDTNKNITTIEEPSADMHTPVVEELKAESGEDIATGKDLPIQASQEEISQEKFSEESATESTLKDTEDGSSTDAAERAGDSGDCLPQSSPPAAEDIKSESESSVKEESETKAEENATVIPLSSEQDEVEVINVENVTSSANVQTVEQQDELVQESTRTVDAPEIELTEEKPDENSVIEVAGSSLNSVPSPVPDKVEQDATEPQVEEKKYSSEEIGSSVDALPPPPPQEEATVDALPPPPPEEEEAVDPPPPTSPEEATLENKNGETVTDAGSGVDSLPPPPPQIDDSVQTQLYEDKGDTTEQTALPPPPQEDFARESELQNKIEPILAPGESVCLEQSKGEKNDSQAVVMESSVDALPASQEESVSDAVEEEPQTQNGGSSVDPGTPAESQPLNEQSSQNSKDTAENNTETAEPSEDSAPQAEDSTANIAVEETVSKQPEESIQVSDIQETNPGETNVDNVSQGSTEVCKNDTKDEEVDETVINGEGLQEEDIPECHSIESDDAEVDEIGDEDVVDESTQPQDESSQPQQIPVSCEESGVTDNKQVVTCDASSVSLIEKQLQNGDNAQKESSSSNPSKMELAE